MEQISDEPAGNRGFFRTPRSNKYRQAAIGYLLYGLIYLAGAIYLSTLGEGPQAGWVWFLIGAVMVLLFPILIWREMKWVTRILALLVGIRLIGLLRLIIGGPDRPIEMPWGADLPIVYGAVVFTVIAGAECYLLIRAGWNLGGRAPRVRQTETL